MENIDIDFQKVNGIDEDEVHKNTIRTWTREEDQLLLHHIKHCKKPVKWKLISTYFKTKSSRQCYSRYKQINPDLNKGKWTKEEEDCLFKYIEKLGKKWSMLAKMLRTRSSKQIRDHYNNCMDLTVNKCRFSITEDELIKKGFMEHGPKWSLIAQNLPGRTGDGVKNRYYWSIKPHHTQEEIESLKGNSLLIKNRKKFIYRHNLWREIQIRQTWFLKKAEKET